MRMYGKHSIKKAIYSLKKHWSAQLDWYKLQSTTTNRRTGEKQTVWSKAVIRKAILMPKTETREFKYSLSYLAANKNFVYGGYFDAEHRYAIVETKDLPRDWVINTSDAELNDKIIINHERYNLKKIENYDDNGVAYLLTMTYVKSTEPEEQLNGNASNTVEVSNDTSVT